MERRPPFLGDREIVYVYFEWELKDSGLAWKAGWTRVLVLHTLLISHIALASSNTLKSMFTGARLQEHTSRGTLHSLHMSRLGHALRLNASTLAGSIPDVTQVISAGLNLTTRRSPTKKIVLASTCTIASGISPKEAPPVV